MTNVAVTTEKRTELEVRLSADLFLIGSGWRTGVVNQRDANGNVWEVFYAHHDQYPSQRAITITELVRRCVWQEDNRTPRKVSESDA